MATVEAGFTNSLLTHLSTRRASISSWLSSEKSQIDSIIEDLVSSHADECANIKKLQQRLDDVREQRGLVGKGGVAQQMKGLEEKQARIEREVEDCRGKNKEGEDRLNELRVQQAEHRAAAVASRSKKMAVVEMKETTLDDLTKGLCNYNYLGLGFESVGREGELLFKFTKLSEVQPNKAFSFLLTLPPDGSYTLSKCEPRLDKKKTDELLRILNTDSDNGLMYFLAGMRTLFKDTL